MLLDTEALQNLLRRHLRDLIRVERRPDGALMLRARFAFPDGDHYPIYLSESAAGEFRLSDRGHTLMHISYERDVDALLDGTSGMLLERIMRESGLRWDDDRGAFCLDTALDRLPEAVFAFGQALTRVYDLASFSRLSADSKFYETLTAFLISIVDESLVKRNYFPEVPNAECYPVDYCIEIEGEKRDPLFLYGVPNQDKARLTTIILSHFHRHNLHFESLLVFEDQAKVSRMDLVRLSDVGGDMISSLESREDITREVLRRVAS